MIWTIRSYFYIDQIDFSLSFQVPELFNRVYSLCLSIEQEDFLLSCVPCLIGRLEVAWIPGKVAPLFLCGV